MISSENNACIIVHLAWLWNSYFLCVSLSPKSAHLVSLSLFASYDQFLPICNPLFWVIPSSFLLLVPACLKKKCGESLLLPCLLQSHLLLDNWNHAWNTGEDREHVEWPNSISCVNIDRGFSANLTSLIRLRSLSIHYGLIVRINWFQLKDNFLPAHFVWFALTRPVMLSFS